MGCSILKLLKANHLSQRYSLEDQIIKILPLQIRSYEERIDDLKAEMLHLAEQTYQNEDGFSLMTIQGTVYAEKKEAITAILAACKAMTNPDSVPHGQYRGFPLWCYSLTV